MKSRGFAISLDAILAMFVLFSIILASVFYLSQIEQNASRSNYLKEFSMDAATVLEKSGKFERAILNNRTNELRTFLNKMPYSICSEIKLYSENESTAKIVLLRPGCRQDYSELASITRSFIVEKNYDLNYYYAEFNSWYRG